MRIVFINTLYYPNLVGGAERTVQEIAEGVLGDGNDVWVVTLSRDHSRHEYVHNGVTVVALPLFNVYHPYVNPPQGRMAGAWKAVWHLVDTFNLVMLRRISAELAAIRADLISTHCLAGFSNAVWLYARAGSIPIIHVLHDYYAICSRSAKYNLNRNANCEHLCLKCRILRSPSKLSSRNVRAVVGVSKYILATHVKNHFFRNAPITEVIYNSSSLTLVSLPRERRGTLRLGFMGSILPEKGIAELLGVVRESSPVGISLSVFGRAESMYARQLKSDTEGARIRWHGHVPASIAMSQIDVLVVPSVWDEPFGRVVIEALSNGVPVIGSCRGGITEILEGSGAGIVYEPLSSPSALRDAIDEMYFASEVEYRDMSRAAISRAADFNRATQVNAFLGLMERVTGLAKCTEVA